MSKILIALALLAVLLFGSFGEYICGRIILPAMGLMAPGYWTWFWFMFWALVFGGTLAFVKEAIFGD